MRAAVELHDCVLSEVLDLCLRAAESTKKPQESAHLRSHKAFEESRVTGSEGYERVALAVPIPVQILWASRI
jgi:hypothetical protein